MSETWQETGGTQTWDFASQIDEVCDLFEAAWKGGGRPEIKDYLQESPVPARAALLAELIPLDMEYRKRKGESVSEDDYRAYLSSAEFTVGSDNTVPLMAGRYRVESEIGEGGMGEVYRVLDPDFNRALAVKVLKKEHQGRADLEARFLEEAQILGQLQHPGVVPVHEIGRLDDGRPFFAMKLVKGETLEKLVQDRSRPDHDLPRFLAIFEQICQTLANAHARGVIHRDLKPSNVMVGAFGEVQVMDWGLAKVLGPARRQPDSATQAPNEQSIIATTRMATTGHLTEAGRVIGTLAFMPPELALGEVEQHDERSDVFLLGGILSVILTGQAPYKSTTGLGVQQAGELQPAYDRLDACGADAELVGLCKACLAPDRNERLRDANVVAERMATYQARVRERLRTTELEHAAAEARAVEAKATAAAERRARRRTIGFAVAVLALVVLGGGGGLWLLRYFTEQREGTESALNTSAGLRDSARWAEAQEVLEQAERRLGATGPADLRRRVTQAHADLQLAKRLDEIRQHQVTIVERKLDYRSADGAYAAAFLEADLGEEGEDVQAVAARVRASAIQAQLVAALDDWAVVRAFATKNPEQSAWLLRVACAADPDDWRDRFRNPKVWKDPAALQALAVEAQAKVAELSPPLLVALGAALRGDELTGNKRGAVSLLDAAQRRYPNNFWLNFQLGNALYDVKKPEDAVGYYRAALAIRPESTAVRNNLGDALADKKDLDGAIQVYRAAIELDPNNALVHNNLGIALADKKDLDGAIQEYRAAIELDPRFALPHNNLGNALRDKKDLDGAIQEYRAAIELDRKSAPPHNGLGSALADKKDLDGAIQEYRAAIKLDPKDWLPHYDLGAALRDKKDLDGAIREYRAAIKLDAKSAPPHNGLGNALQDKKDLDGAIQEYRAAIELDPKDVRPHNGLGNALRDKKDLDGAIQEYRAAIELDAKHAPPHNGLGNVLRDKKDLDGAIQEYRAAMKLDPKLAGPHSGLGNVLLDKKDLDGAIHEYRAAIGLDPTLAIPHYGLGNVLRDKKDLDGAIQEYRAAIELDAKLALPHYGLGTALYDKKDLDGAIQEFRAAIELDPKDALPHSGLGTALRDKKDLDGAIREFRTAIDLDTKNAKPHSGLAMALHDKKDLDGAIQEYRAAIELDPKDWLPHYNVGNVLRDKKDLDGAVQEFQKAIKLQPDHAEAHCNLGHALRRQGKFTEALEALREGHKLGLKKPGWRYPSAQWVRDAERLVELERKLSAILEGKDKPADDAERIALAQLCQDYKKLHASSARFYAEALEAKPELANDLRNEHRYDAACAAALAGCGQGEDAAKLDDKDLVRLRNQALAWLRADLDAWTKLVNQGKADNRAATVKMLRHWQADPDLAGVRDKAALEKLPDAERANWENFWFYVAELLKKVDDMK